MHTHFFFSSCISDLLCGKILSFYPEIFKGCIRSLRCINSWINSCKKEILECPCVLGSCNFISRCNVCTLFTLCHKLHCEFFLWGWEPECKSPIMKPTTYTFGNRGFMKDCVFERPFENQASPGLNFINLRILPLHFLLFHLTTGKNSGLVYSA